MAINLSETQLTKKIIFYPICLFPSCSLETFNFLVSMEDNQP